MDAFNFANQSKKIGLIIASLFAMFAYMAKVEYKQKAKSSHPHPLIRAQYVGDVILYQVSAKLDIPIQEIEECKIDYIYQACIALEEMELFIWNKFNSDFNNVHENVLSLRESADRLRPFCREWAWVPLNLWK